MKKQEEIQAHEEEIQRGRMAKRQRLLEEQKTTGQSVVSTQSIHIDTNLDDIKINTLPEKSCAVQICTGEVKLGFVI